MPGRSRKATVCITFDRPLRHYHPCTGTIGSILTYLATTGQVFMGVELFNRTLVMPQKFVLRKNLF